MKKGLFGGMLSFFQGGRLFLPVFLLISLLAPGVLAPVNAAAFDTLRTGMKAPDFALTGINGQTMNFSDVKGKKLTVLVFWSTWGYYCKDALQQMAGLYDKYKDKGLSVIAINVNRQNISGSDLSRINAEIKDMGLDLPVSIDYGLATWSNFGVEAVPSTVVLDKNRVIKYQLSGFPMIGVAQMADYIKTALKSGASQSQMQDKR